MGRLPCLITIAFAISIFVVHTQTIAAAAIYAVVFADCECVTRWSVVCIVHTDEPQACTGQQRRTASLFHSFNGQAVIPDPKPQRANVLTQALVTTLEAAMYKEQFWSLKSANVPWKIMWANVQEAVAMLC